MESPNRHGTAGGGAMAADRAHDAFEPRRAMRWQLPAMMLGLLLIGLGLYTFSNRAPADDFDGALDQIEAQLEAGLTADAAQSLRESIQPNLDRASRQQTARFHVLSADRFFQEASVATARDTRIWDQVAEHYAAAIDHGLTLTAVRLERWADALIQGGNLDAARARVASLEAMNGVGSESQVLFPRVAALRRRLVDAAINQSGAAPQQAIDLLSEYRADPACSEADDAWAAARQAELRLLEDRPHEAADWLHIDIRRAEHREGVPPAALSELLVLLGRAQHQLGSDDEASYALDLALEQLASGNPLRGAAVELLGRIALARGEHEHALELFDSVVRDFVGTPAHLPALLGRAEVRSMLGQHQQSLDDFTALRDLLGSALGKHNQTGMRDRLVAALIDRHDAALATGRLELGLEYLASAERCYPGSSVPPEVVHRIAMTSRQRAQDLTAAALATPSQRPPNIADDSPAGPDSTHTVDSESAEARDAVALFRRAADHFVTHARSLAAGARHEGAWADSLWLAADSYERAGEPALALEHFREYLAGSQRSDPRHVEAMFRMAQVHHAMLEFEHAISLYEQVIQEHPHSPLAARCHVPLSRCFVALDRRPEAQQQLRQVLDGRQLLTPDAAHYADAQFELGELYFREGDFRRAIETLDTAIEANAADTRVREAKLQLAQCYLKHALAGDERLEAPDMGAAERVQIAQAQREHLNLALNTYDAAIETMEMFHDDLDAMGRDALRAAYLARGDCAFHLGRFDQRWYERAANLYDQAARRYSDQSMSLTAIIQMIKCYGALGDDDRAQAARHRAQARLEQLPDSAFDAPDGMLDREAWERWLRNDPPQLPQARAAAESTLDMTEVNAQ